jgi:hypothetical protein
MLTAMKIEPIVVLLDSRWPYDYGIELGAAPPKTDSPEKLRCRPTTHKGLDNAESKGWSPEREKREADRLRYDRVDIPQ